MRRSGSGGGPKAALKSSRKAMRKHGRPEAIVTDRLRSYGAALKNLGAHAREETGRWLYDRAEDSHLPFRRRERAMLRCRGMRSLQKLPLSTPPSSTTSTRNEAFPAETSSNWSDTTRPCSNRVRLTLPSRVKPTTFGPVHTLVLDHLNQERCLPGRDIFKTDRAAAHAERRRLLAA